MAIGRKAKEQRVSMMREQQILSFDCMSHVLDTNGDTRSAVPWPAGSALAPLQSRGIRMCMLSGGLLCRDLHVLILFVWAALSVTIPACITHTYPHSSLATHATHAHVRAYGMHAHAHPHVLAPRMARSLRPTSVSSQSFCLCYHGRSLSKCGVLPGLLAPRLRWRGRPTTSRTAGSMRPPQRSCSDAPCEIHRPTMRGAHRGSSMGNWGCGPMAGRFSSTS